MLVIEKECLPALALVVVRFSLREISRDGGEANRNPKLLKLGLDLPGAPSVLIRESMNQGLNFIWNRRPSGTALWDGSPVEPKTLAVPSNYCFVLDDDEGLFSSRPDLWQKNPEGSVGRSDPGLGSHLGVGGQLLTQSELNERLLFLASKEGRKTAQEDRCEFEQVPHSEAHFARVDCPILDWFFIRIRTIIGRWPIKYRDGKAQWFRGGPILRPYQADCAERTAEIRGIGQFSLRFVHQRPGATNLRVLHTCQEV
jgi:hypothetical protein